MTTINQNNVLTEILRKLLLIYYDKCFMTFVLAAITSLLSKYAFIFSTLLPLKIILILNTSEIPHYFPDFFNNIEYSSSIYLLCLFSTALFFVYLGLEKLNTNLIHASRYHYINKKKIAKLKNNHIQLIDRIFSFVTEGFAYTVFIISILILLLILFKYLLYFIFLFVLISVIGLHFLARNNNFKIYFNNNFNFIISFISNICFLFSFFFIVYLELNNFGKGLLISLISLLLLRQCTSYIVSISNYLKFFMNNSSKIKTLLL